MYRAPSIRALCSITDVSFDVLLACIVVYCQSFALWLTSSDARNCQNHVCEPLDVGRYTLSRNHDLLCFMFDYHMKASIGLCNNEDFPFPVMQCFLPFYSSLVQ